MDDLNLRKLVTDTYRNVWKEYSEWSDSHNRSVLRSLAAPVDRALKPLPVESDSDDEDLPSDLEATDSSDASLSGVINVRYNVTEIIISDYVHHYPSYESCPATARNLMVGDDPSTLPFIPFADDPAFDYESYALEHDDFEWQRSVGDPDGTCVFEQTFISIYQINCSRGNRLHGLRHLDRVPWREN